jgi:hypothetical protein
MTRSELLTRMDADEFEDWKILEQIDPWGQQREDWRIALLASQVAGLVGSKKQDGKPFRAVDCLLEFKTDLPDSPDDDDPQTAEEQRRQRAAAIERQMLGSMGIGGKKTGAKKLIQEVDKV